jgi:hypothetical protein
MKIFAILSLTLTTSAFAQLLATSPYAPVIETNSISCRDAIVEGLQAIGEATTPDSFSVEKFEDSKISITEFNDLTIDEREVIYQKIMPMELKQAQTMGELRGARNYFSQLHQQYMSQGVLNPRILDRVTEITTMMNQLESCFI